MISAGLSMGNGGRAKQIFLEICTVAKYCTISRASRDPSLGGTHFEENLLACIACACGLMAFEINHSWSS